MSADTIQARYDELESIAARFGNQAEANATLHGRVQRGVQDLQQGGWEGEGVDAFLAEMEGEVFPSMQRLTTALDEARSVTLKVKDIIQQAEQEAAGVFQNGDAGGSAGGAASGSAGQPSLPEVVETPPGTFDGRRAPYTVSPPQEVSNHSFRSGAADALRYDVQIGDRNIAVFAPKTPDASQGHIHSVEEIAKGLAALPEQSRNLVTQVNVDPAQNPDDAYWAQEYNTPNFRSYMTAGASGAVDVYPTSNPIGQDYLDGTMIHETGHILSQQSWGAESDARWNDWKAAVRSDGAVVSKYAQNSPGEDFSETLLHYYQVQGTPQAAEARSQMPARFRIIDDMLAGGR
jgi:WXG100 family type VII secretion target